MITLFKIKKGKETKLKRWLKRIQTELQKEALGSMKKQNLTRECVGIIAIDTKRYLWAFTEASGPEIMQNDGLSKKHRKIMEDCLIFPSFRAESIYDLKS